MLVTRVFARVVIAAEDGHYERTLKEKDLAYRNVQGERCNKRALKWRRGSHQCKMFRVFHTAFVAEQTSKSVQNSRKYQGALAHVYAGERLCLADLFSVKTANGDGAYSALRQNSAQCAPSDASAIVGKPWRTAGIVEALKDLGPITRAIQSPASRAKSAASSSRGELRNVLGSISRRPWRSAKKLAELVLRAFDLTTAKRRQSLSRTIEIEGQHRHG